MNRKSKKSARRSAVCLAALGLFAVLLYLVGAVEQGAAMSRMFWALPVLAALSACAGLYEKI